MNLMKWSALFFCIIVFISCKKNNSSTGNAGACNNTFSFLQNGHALSYNMDLFGTQSTSVVTYTSTSDPNVFLQTIKDSIDPSFNNAKVYFKGCNGWLTQSYTSNVPDTGYFIKETRKVGDAWKYNDITYNDINDYSVYQTNVSVTVAGGTFTCDEILYYQEGTFNTDTIWWNNNYGTIKYSGVLLQQELTGKNY